MSKKEILFIFILILVGLAIRMIISPIVYHGDMYNHFEWGKVALHEGLYGIYERPLSSWTSSVPNQPPLSLYIFMIIRWLYELLDQLFWWLNNHVPVFPSKLIWFFEEKGYSILLKIPAVIADIGITLLIYRFTRPLTTAKKALLASSVYFLNPITIYNSAWWGQTDATVNFFGLLAIMFLLRKKLIAACLALTVCLLIKASLLLLLPLLIAIALRQRYSIKTIMQALGISLLFAFIITLPFHNLYDPLWLGRLYIGQIVLGTLSHVSENTFNLWGVIFSTGGPYPADVRWLGISAKILGYGLFGIVTVWTMWQLRRPKTIDQQLLFIACLACAGFLFLTGMRERYLFPIFPLLATVMAFRPRLLGLYIVLSIVHLANLYMSWSAPHIESLYLFVHLPWIAPLSFIILLVSFLYCCSLSLQPKLKVQG